MNRGLCFVLCMLLLIAFSSLAIEQQSSKTEYLLEQLAKQNIKSNQIIGVDQEGIPLVCRTTDEKVLNPSLSIADFNPDSLPPDTRGWACIPSVILADGIDEFYLEVNTNGEVRRVMIPSPWFFLVPPYPDTLFLLDNGSDGDRVAGDYIFTIGPFSFNTGSLIYDHLYNDATSPAGLDIKNVGDVVIEEMDFTTSTFLLYPKVGLLSPEIPSVASEVLASDVVITPHLINIQTGYHATQRFLHVPGLYYIPTLTQRIYELLPDEIDMFMFFSTYKIERLPRTNSSNFVSGVHATAIIDYTGSSSGMFDGSSTYGSNGVLLGLNGLDTYDRGILSNNAMHEITHQWAAKIDASLGITDGSHYKFRSSVGSLVGGSQWINNGDGTYYVNCQEGSGGAHQAPPLDKYMAGVMYGFQVPTIHKYADTLSGQCYENVESVLDVTIEDIQTVQGVRTPSPELSKQKFNLAFVAESNGRLLTEIELTFYDILAEHYTKPIPDNDPDPYLRFNWVPVGRFWGPGVTWNSDIVTTPTGVADDYKPSIPVSIKLLQNIPNPFKSSTKIEYTLSSNSSATLCIYDAKGRSIRSFNLQNRPLGDSFVEWDAKDSHGNHVASGIYFYRLEVGDQELTKKMILLK